MKKHFLNLLLMLPLVWGLSGCGGDDVEEISPQKTEEQEKDDKKSQNVIVYEDGTTSNGSRFVGIDDKNFYIDYIKYSVEEGHLVVSGYDKTGFQGNGKFASNITYNGSSYEVLRILNSAFKGCTILTSVTIPSSVTSIDEFTFSGCIGLNSVSIPEGVTCIERYAFEGCTSLTSVIIPSGVTYIDEFTFSDCTGLTSVTLPKSMTDIGFYAFSGCTGLTSITIPNSVTDIGSGAFSFCTGLTSITIPSSVTEIDFDSFLGCIGLNEIIIDKENKVYDSRDKSNAIIQTETNMILCGCKSTIIPNTVTSIGSGAFSFCTGLTSITIPSSVTDIGSDAFEYCTGLTSIHCKCKTPPNCDYSSFKGISAEVTLYVPKGSLNAYKEARGWGNCFKNIVEE